MLISKVSAERRVGSNPTWGTNSKIRNDKMIKEVTATELLSSLTYSEYLNGKNTFEKALKYIYKLCNKIQYKNPNLSFDVSERALDAFKSRNKNISFESGVLKVDNIRVCLRDIKKGLPSKTIYELITC